MVDGAVEVLREVEAAEAGRVGEGEVVVAEEAVAHALELGGVQPFHHGVRHLRCARV